MTAHTPGPWHRNIKPVKRYSVVFAGRNTHVAAISNNSGVSKAEMEANCDLIAAAPELLEALDNACRAMQIDAPRKRFREIDAARAAIAKATGGAP